MRVQYSPERIPKWVGDFSNTKEYRGYLHSIGIALPDESGDVTMGEADSPVFDSPDLGGDSGVSEGIPVDTPSTSVANHTQSLPSTTSQPHPPTTTHPSPPTPTHEKPSPKPRKRHYQPQKRHHHPLLWRQRKSHYPDQTSTRGSELVRRRLLSRS